MKIKTSNRLGLQVIGYKLQDDNDMENKKSSYLIPITILVAGLIIGGAIMYKHRNGGTAGPNPPDSKISEDLSDDDAALGDQNAPITIIEFSDYECPYCKKFWENTLPEIKEKYINTGKVKFIYRDFPLASHKDAQKAAEATECADEQGKFWEMQDKIFQNQSAMVVSDLKRYAADLGLDEDSFNKCLDSGEYKNEVKKDFSDGEKAKISGTPTFFIGSKEKGFEKLVGAQPFGAFEQVIEGMLK